MNINRLYGRERETQTGGLTPPNLPCTPASWRHHNTLKFGDMNTRRCSAPLRPVWHRWCVITEYRWFIISLDSRHENMMTFRNPSSHKHFGGYMRVRSRRGNWLAVVLLRISRRDLFFCLTALLIFCLGSVLYQLKGEAPKILLDVGYYLGKTSNIGYCMRLSGVVGEVVTVEPAAWCDNMKYLSVLSILFHVFS